MNFVYLINRYCYMRRLYILFLLLINFNAFSQTGSVSGIVSDSSLKSVLTGAIVTISGTNLGTATDAFGRFVFNDLIIGNYEIKIHFLGYKPFTIKVEVKENQNTSIIADLQTDNFDIREVSVSSKDNDVTTSIGNIDMQLRPVNAAQDLYRLVPGLFIAQHAGGGKAEQIFLRGFDCDHGTDFNVSIDGLPVNMVSHAHGQGYADFHFVIPETVDHLNVYKGPYTAKFGDFATTGAGEYITKNTFDKDEIKIEYGEFNTERIFAEINLLNQKHLFSDKKESAYIAGEYVYTNSYFDNKQKFHRINLFGKYDGLLTDKTSLMISASTFNAGWDASGQIPSRAVNGGIELENGTTTGPLISRFGSMDPSEGGNTRRSNANLILIAQVGDNTIIKNQFYYTQYDFNLYSDFTFFLVDTVHGDQLNQTDNRNIYGYSGTIENNYKLFNRNLKTTFGLGYRNDVGEIKLRHSENRVDLDTIVDGNLNQKNASSYIEETYDITNKFSVDAALRLDYFDFDFVNMPFYNVLEGVSYRENSNKLSGDVTKARLSPKLNLYYKLNTDVQLYLKSGIGFHSNDARAIVVNKLENTLPKATGAEVGSTFKIGRNAIFNVALWGLDLENELTYNGDDGTVAINGPTRRYGSDFALRYQLTKILFADMDLNYSHGRFVDSLPGHNFIPLAPSLTSIAGLSIKQDKGFNASLRYRYINDRPANQHNTVIAKGYFLLDGAISYNKPRYQIGLTVENILNSQWNQAQFDTESRLKVNGVLEAHPVDELHFTPGTPLFIKGNISIFF